MPTDAEPTNAGHTPEPWFPSAPLSMNIDLKILRIDSKDSAIALIIPYGKSPEETKDNIRLIAAAPDLLAALKLAFEHVGSGHIADIKIIEAALGKAEPEEGGAS